MPGYIIAHYTVTDAQGLREYAELVMPMLEAHGAKVLVMDGASRVMEGEAPQQSVVVRFASVEAAQRFYDCAEYQSLRRLRTASSTNGSLVIVEGSGNAG